MIRKGAIRRVDMFLILIRAPLGGGGTDYVTLSDFRREGRRETGKRPKEMSQQDQFQEHNILFCLVK